MPGAGCLELGLRVASRELGEAWRSSHLPGDDDKVNNLRCSQRVRSVGAEQNVGDDEGGLGAAADKGAARQAALGVILFSPGLPRPASAC